MVKINSFYIPVLTETVYVRDDATLYFLSITNVCFAIFSVPF